MNVLYNSSSMVKMLLKLCLQQMSHCGTVKVVTSYSYCTFTPQKGADHTCRRHLPVGHHRIKPSDVSSKVILLPLDELLASCQIIMRPRPAVLYNAWSFGEEGVGQYNGCRPNEETLDVAEIRSCPRIGCVKIQRVSWIMLAGGAGYAHS